MFQNWRPYLERAALMVVPVRAGSGMRVRILEAFAHAMPILTTSIGLEGIDAVPGEDVLVADNVDDFTGSVVSLLRNDGVQISSLSEEEIGRETLRLENCIEKTG